MKVVWPTGGIVLCICGLAFAQAGVPKTARADWLQKARWGVFTHYMADTVVKEASVDAWNRTVDGFDVEGLAAQLSDIGAGYYIITLGQNSGFYCSPNGAYDAFVGIQPSKCSKRDLVADLSAALEKRGIRLMVYLPAGAPDRDPVAMEALQWKNGKHPRWDTRPYPPEEKDDRLVEFQKKWEAVIGEWSKRWGRRVCGWWFDGCYFPEAMYRHPEAPNFASFAAAARAGNPDSIVAFNPGVTMPIITLTPEEDYTAGEINDADKVECTGSRVEQAQFHMLSYLGKSWASGPPRYADEKVISITRSIVDKGGAVSWDVPIQANGLISEPFLSQLKALGQAMGRPAESK